MALISVEKINLDGCFSVIMNMRYINCINVKTRTLKILWWNMGGKKKCHWIYKGNVDKNGYLKFKTRSRQKHGHIGKSKYTAQSISSISNSLVKIIKIDNNNYKILYKYMN